VNTNRTARIHPWPDEDTPDWVAASAPLHLYADLRKLQHALEHARADADRNEVLERLREHVDVTMRRAGLDEHRIVEDYERHFANG
jgi:hypothetical protein